MFGFFARQYSQCEQHLKDENWIPSNSWKSGLVARLLLKESQKLTLKNIFNDFFQLCLLICTFHLPTKRQLLVLGFQGQKQVRQLRLLNLEVGASRNGQVALVVTCSQALLVFCSKGCN